MTPFTRIAYYLVPFGIVFGWLVFALWGRRKSLLRRFDSLFNQDSGDIKIVLPLNLPGKIYRSAKFACGAVGLYGQYTVIGYRFIWYVIVVKEIKSQMNEIGFYGKGPSLDYIELSNPSLPTFPKDQLKGMSQDFCDWEFAFITDKQAYFFHRLPDFFGDQPMKKIRGWIDESME